MADNWDDLLGGLLVVCLELLLGRTSDLPVVDYLEKKLVGQSAHSMDFWKEQRMVQQKDSLSGYSKGYWLGETLESTSDLNLGNQMEFWWESN